MHIGKKNPGHDFSIYHGILPNNETHNIDSCDEEKALGITFDKCISFDPHLQNVIKKANKMLGLIFIKRTFSYLTRDVFVWYLYLKRQSIALEKIQWRGTKILKI